MKRSLKDKIGDILLKKKDQMKRTLRNSLPIFRLLRKKSQETI